MTDAPNIEYNETEPVEVIEPYPIHSETDWQRCYGLLKIIESAALHGTVYTALIGAAAAELNEMNVIAQKEINERARVIAEAQAKVAAIEADRQAKEAKRQAAQDEEMKLASVKAADEKRKKDLADAEAHRIAIEKSTQRSAPGGVVRQAQPTGLTGTNKPAVIPADQVGA